MSKSRSSARVFSREFKLSIVNRMLAGENVSALARETRLLRKDLYVWRERFLAGGPDALRGRGRPPKSAARSSAESAAPPAGTASDELAAARARIAELERKVGQQQLDLDFFRQALRQVRGARRPSAAPGVPASTKSSKG